MMILGYQGTQIQEFMIVKNKIWGGDYAS